MQAAFMHIAASVLLLATSVRCFAGSPSLVGWWKLDDGSGSVARDSSGFGNDGTIIGATWSSGLEKALNFDGRKDWVIVLDSDAISVGRGDYTISVWIWPRKTAGEQGIVAKVKNVSHKEYALSLYGSQLRLDVENSGNTGRAETKAGAVVADCWQHVAITFDSTQKKATFYVNGVVQQTAEHNISALPDELEDDLYIGRWGGSYAHERRDFDGLIRDVRIYNTVLSADEIESLYADTVIQTGLDDTTEEAAAAAYEILRQFGDWRVNAAIKAKHGNQIAGALMVIARAKEIRGYPVADVVREYRHIAEQFPHSPHATSALARISILDGEDGLRYARQFLEKHSTQVNAARFYGRVIESCTAQSDYQRAEKYVLLFMQKYVAQKPDSSKIVAQLMGDIGPLEDFAELDRMIMRHAFSVTGDAKSCGVILRYRLSQLSRTGGFDQLKQLARWIAGEFASTELAGYAPVLEADCYYQRDDFVAALEAFRPGLFDRHVRDSETIGAIDNAIRLYGVRTLRVEGVDSAKMYHALAEHAQAQNLTGVALHCYRRAAAARGLELSVFEKAASASTTFCSGSPQAQIWFWKGLFAAEHGNFSEAVTFYRHFLEEDDSSVLAARAYYDTARARMALGRDATAEIAKAKAISPCEPVINLERIYNPADSTATED